MAEELKIDSAARPVKDKVHTSAVCIIPPDDLAGPIQAIRAVHDKHIKRWMPHVNLLYPFVPDTQFDEAVKRLTAGLAEVAPFEVSLDQFGTFNHGRSSVLWLQPSAQNKAVHQLQHALEQVYPQCNDLSVISDAGFSPHLTVGQIGSTQIEHTKNKFQANWKPITFMVDHVCLISRSDVNDPFHIRHRVPLGKKA